MRVVSGRTLLIAALLAAASSGTVWFARRIPVQPPPAPEYGLAASWLCRPGRDDACARPTTATVLAVAGERTVETFKADPKAPIDCFYVYPTVSRVRAAYAPIEATAQETSVVRNQLARFGAVCRFYAPLYRQVTNAGLPLLFGGKRGVTIDVPYADILAAWRSYLARDNGGRGIVLIGHSQGARLLARLIKEEIDGKPTASTLVSAIVAGTGVYVPEGRVVGGTYHHIPLCSGTLQPGCVIAYSSYLADHEMPAHPRFGVSQTAGLQYACVDPSALDGTKALAADLPLGDDQRATYGTDFTEIPGLLTATCRTDGPVSVLAIGAKPTDRAGEDTRARLEHIVDDNPAFGLHELDINIALGTLVDIVRKQTAVYLRR